MVDTSKVTRK